MKAKTGQPRKKQGMVLVGVMMVLMLVLSVILIGLAGSGRTSGSLSDTTTGSVRLTKMRAGTLQAQNLADAGVRQVMQWLNVQSSAPTNMTAFRPSQITSYWTGSEQNGNFDRITFTDPTGATVGTIDVRLFPFSNNNTVTMRSYMIESIGTYQGQQQIVHAGIIQDTFAKYAFFADNAPTGTWWTSQATFFNGPVHVNARNMDSTSPSYNANAAIKILWKSSGTNTQIFKYNASGAFTTSAAANKVSWYKNSTTTLSAPSTSSDWLKVAAGGQSTISAGVAMVDMPTQSTRQSDAAIGSPPATIPAGPSVTVPASGGATSGGVYINGDVDNMLLTATGTNKNIQGIEIYQNDGTKLIKTVVTLDPNSGTNGQVTVRRYTTPDMNSTTYTEQTSGGYPQTMSGMTNGVVYVNGNVGKPSVPPVGNVDGTPTTLASGGLSGTVADNLMNGSTVKTANSLSIVTNSNNSVNISGDIRYNTTSGGAATTKTGTLGIVTKKAQIISNLDAVNGDAMGDGLANVSVHATVMCYDTFNAEDPLNRAIANFTLLGGYIVTNSGTFAGIDSSGKQWTGFTVTRNYDSRVANAPPPYFPSTGNQYKVRSYKRDNFTL